MNRTEKYKFYGAYALCQAGLDHVDVPCLLALIQVESAGDPVAYRAGSQFRGLLQMGRMACIDVGIDDQKELHGRPHEAIDAFIDYQNRYEGRVWAHEAAAILWKGGPGTVKTVGEVVDQGRTLDEAMRFAADKHDIPNLKEYVRRYREARARYM